MSRPLSIAVADYDSWSAVVRGAAAKGLEIGGKGLVKNRKCRRHYGTDSCPSFIYGVHAQTDAYIDDFDGVQRARDQMAWLVKRGQNLSSSTTAKSKLTFCQNFWIGTTRKAQVILLASAADVAAKSASHMVSHHLCIRSRDRANVFSPCTRLRLFMLT